MAIILRNLPKYWPAALTLITGIGFTIHATTTLEQLERDRVATEHSRNVASIAASVQEAINAKLNAPISMATLIESAQSVKEQQFQEFSAELIQRDRSINTLSWVPYVTHRNRSSYEAQYGPILDSLPNGQLQTATQRPEYFPTQQFSSTEDGITDLGWDWGREFKYRQAIANAHGSGLVSISNLVKLPNHKAGFTAFVPVPRPGRQPDRDVEGFVNAVFPLQDFIEDAVTKVRPRGQEMYILYYGGDQEKFWMHLEPETQGFRLQQGSLPDLTNVCPRIKFCRGTIQLAQDQWQIIVPLANFGQLSWDFQQQLWLMRGFGCTMTVILTIYMMIGIRQQKRIEELVGTKIAQAEQLHGTLTELQNTQAQLIQSEKMSSLGQLVAGIAHEINNPINFIHGNLKHVTNYSQDLLTLFAAYDQNRPQGEINQLRADYEIDFLREDLPKVLKSMETGTARIREIVLSLRNFSRLDEAERKVVDIHEGIESTLMILTNQLKGKPQQPTIEVIKQYGDLPTVSCYPGLFNQVLMNLLANAIDAVRDCETDRYPKITIQTSIVNHMIRVGIRDNGSGISPAAQKSLFNPFFTTKPVGVGTGLGLSISYKIITEQHKGRIWVDSTVNKGSSFWIEIPQSSAEENLELAKSIHISP